MADHSLDPIPADVATVAAPPRRIALAVSEGRPRGPLGQLLERENFLAYVLLAPTLLILTVFIAYPFALGIWLSVSDKVVGRPGHFVGLANLWTNLSDTIFLRAFQNKIGRASCRER